MADLRSAVMESLMKRLNTNPEEERLVRVAMLDFQTNTLKGATLTKLGVMDHWANRGEEMLTRPGYSVEHPSYVAGQAAADASMKVWSKFEARIGGE
jgi:hypothetical protein